MNTPSLSDGLDDFALVNLFPKTPPRWSTLFNFAVAMRNGLLFSARDAVADRFTLAAIVEGLQRREKVLVLSHSTAATDQLMFQMPDAPGRIVRVVGPLETRVAGITVYAAGDGRVDDAIKRFSASMADTQAQLDLWSDAAHEWVHLKKLVDRVTNLTQQLSQLSAKREKLAESVRAELVDAERDSAAAHATAHGDLTTALATATAKRAAIEQQQFATKQSLAQMSELVEAKKQGRLLSGSFWRAMLMGDPATKRVELQQQLDTLATEWSTADEDVKRLKKQKQAADKEWAKAWEARIAAELHEARQRLHSQITQTECERAAVDIEFKDCCERLSALNLVPPTELTTEAIDRAEHQLAARRQDADASLKYAQSQMAELTANRAQLIESYLRQVQVVVGSRSALENRWLSGQRFDRIVVQGADFLTRSEWDTVNTLSEQLVVVGNWPARPITSSNGQQTWTSPVTDLWNEWHRTNWFREADRLVCRLAIVAGPLTREELLDRPEVELRFGTTSAGDYVLAEVAFPTTLAVATAKRLMVELGDVSVNPFGPVRWHDDKFMVCWPLLDGIDGEWIELEAGVREQIVTIEGVPMTAAISFDSDAGWTRERANDWLSNHAPTPNGRTIVLQG